MRWGSKETVSFKDAAGQWHKISWDDIQRFEKEMKESGRRLPKEEWRRLQELKSQFPRVQQKQDRSQRLKKGVSKFNKTVSGVEHGAKTVAKGWDRRVIQGGSQKKKSGYWRHGTFYPYKKSYTKKKNKKDKQYVKSNGQDYVIVDDKAYPVVKKSSKKSSKNYNKYQSRRSKEYVNHRKKQKKDDEPEINSFFNIFG